MSRFFVGQRVRCVAPWRNNRGTQGVRDWVQLKGAEAVVNEIGCINSFGEEGIGISALGRDDWIMPPYGLEPILSVGHQPAELTIHELLPFLKEQVTA